MRTTRIQQAMAASGRLTLSILLLAVNSSRLPAEEQPIQPLHPDQTSAGPVAVLRNSLGLFNGFNLFAVDRINRFDLPLRPRVSHSTRMLRQCELTTGDHFLGELVGWNDDSAAFRLLTGQQIHVPIGAVFRLANPPGEIDFIDESFESYSSVRKKFPAMIDETQSADGSASLKIIEPYLVGFDEPLESVRIEFCFQISANPVSSTSWQLNREKDSTQQSPITIQVRGGEIACVDMAARESQASTQTLALATGWHSFIAIASPERTRLIVDQSILASFATNGHAIKSIEFRPDTAKANAPVLIDALQVRRFTDAERAPFIPVDQDAIETATGDLWLGKLKNITQEGAVLRDQRQTNIVPWNRIASITRVMPKESLRQTAPAAIGSLATIEMQPFVDRPECPPEKWTVTITRSDAEQVTVVHPLIGELTFRWADIAQIQTDFFGQSFLLDGRRIHLGNSIRPEFQQPFPSGTSFQNTFRLKAIPNGQPFVSMDVSEMEAASSDAPPASPFLSELRDGKLVTELFINEHRVGDLNSLLRFKTKSPGSERLRIPFSRELLRSGQNTVRLSQKPLSDSHSEFDDCEIRQIRVEFDLSDARE